MKRHYAILGNYGSLSGPGIELCGFSDCRKPYRDPIHIQPEEAHEPEPTEAAPLRDPSRCSLDGAARIPLDRERTKFGVCTLVAGKDGKGGCKDPLHDYNAEREAVVGGQPPKITSFKQCVEEGPDCDCVGQCKFETRPQPQTPLSGTLSYVTNLNTEPETPRPEMGKGRPMTEADQKVFDPIAELEYIHAELVGHEKDEDLSDLLANMEFTIGVLKEMAAASGTESAPCLQCNRPWNDEGAHYNSPNPNRNITSLHWFNPHWHKQLEDALKAWAKESDSVPDFWDELCVTENIAEYLCRTGFRKYASQPSSLTQAEPE